MKEGGRHFNLNFIIKWVSTLGLGMRPGVISQFIWLNICEAGGDL